MKKILFATLVLVCSYASAIAQQQDPEKLHETARTFMKQNDLDNAVLVLDRANQLKPDDIEIAKDLAYVSLLKRDFSKSIDVAKSLVEKPNADVQCYQILGMALRATAQNEECAKIYKKGIAKFPNKGILYSEYGELELEKNPSSAIKLWEKGIESDPSNSGNFYNASKYYSQKNEVLWAVLYGENFINIESLTARTAEIKEQLTADYKKLFTANTLSDAARKGSPFIKAVANLFLQNSGMLAEGVTPESLTSVRSKFVLQWYDNSTPKFPYRLFEYQRTLIQEGMFEAYNQWIFGADSYEAWAKNHDAEAKALQKYQRGMVYKIPAGQYYEH